MLAADRKWLTGGAARYEIDFVFPLLKVDCSNICLHDGPMADSLMPKSFIGSNISAGIAVPFNYSGVLEALKTCTHCESPGSGE